MVARPWSSSSLFCGERLLLRCDGNARNSFPTTQGKDQFFRAIRWKRGSSSCGRDSSASSRAVAAVSLFSSRGPRDLWLSLEAFPRGFPTGLSHVPPWCRSIVSLKVEAVQGKQVSLEWTETCGRLWKWWHDPGILLTFPVESASS